jgi:endonuclease/exonuclease/phosphatase family metal-dependent hydrolase
VIGGERIDWIVASPQFQTLNAEIGRRMPAGRFPSDHWPVTARLRLQPVAALEP